MKKMTTEERIHCMKVCKLDCCCCHGPGGMAHHMLGGGMGLKAPHFSTMPMCNQCHVDLHTASGRFKTVTKAERREWEAKMVAATKKVLGHGQ